MIKYPQGEVLRKEGDCEKRFAPASTFKLPLAVMGFDSGILRDAHTPRWPFTTKYGPIAEREQQETDPAIWLKDSIIWYSRQLTEQLGAKKFAGYLEQFDYGNRDASGTPDKRDGLLNAWLFTSLQISVREQVEFVRKLLALDLGVSAHACNMTLATLPRFTAGEWQVQGKTGSGWLRDAQGNYDKSFPQGWFIGFAMCDKQQLIFARHYDGTQAIREPAGHLMRDQILAELADYFPQR